jgi:Tol biopolymer transport system component
MRWILRPALVTLLLLSSSVALAGWLGSELPAVELSFARFQPRDLTYGVYLIDAWRGLDVPLGMEGRFMGPPAWSRDGRWLIANTGGQITRLDMLDMSLTHVQQPWLGTEVSLSPDGTRLVFTLWVGTDNAPLLFTGAPDGDARNLLTEMVALAPAWSPDGESVVFVALREGGRLYEVQAEGGDVRRITDVSARNPAWSPDGTRLAFGALDASDMGDVFSINRDGSDLRQLTITPWDERYPAWSPAGDWLAYSTTGGNENSYDLDIYIMRPDGSDPHRLTRVPSSEVFPAWRPAG